MCVLRLCTKYVSAKNISQKNQPPNNMKRKQAFGPSRPTAYQKKNVKRYAAPAPARISNLYPIRTRATLSEKKNIDIVTANSLVFATATGVVIPINVGITNGASSTQHVGRRINLTSLLLRWRVTVAPTTTGAACLRCLVVYDKQSNGAAATAAQVLTVDSFTSPMNLGYNHRFTVISDEYIPTIGTAGPQSVFYTVYRKFRLPVEYNETNGGTIADILTGGMFAILYQSGGLLVASPTDTLHTRVRFQDA